MSKLIKDKILNNSFYRNDQAINSKKEKGFDLTKFTNPKELKDWIFKSKKDFIELTNSANISLINDEFTKASNADDIKRLFSKYNIILSKTSYDGLVKNFTKYKDDALNRLIEGVESTSNKFKKIKIENEEKLRDTSVWFLNVGMYYITGEAKGKVFNAPLITFPVSVEVDKNNNIRLKKLTDTYTTNKKLNFFLNQNFGFNFEDFESTEISEFEKYYKETIENRISKSDKIEFDSNFKEIAIDEQIIDKHLWNFNKNIFLTLMDPEGGIILQDIVQIIEKDTDLFKKGNPLWPKTFQEKYVNNVLMVDDVLSIGNKLNIYQKYAIKTALNENIVIHGPPGTGKSETIASLIVNILNENKNVLVVSEKKAALDVITKRLNKLSVLALDASDLSDKQVFYKKISDLCTLLQQNNSNKINPNLEDNNLFDKIKPNFDFAENFKLTVSKLKNNYTKYLICKENQFSLTKGFEIYKRIMSNWLNQDNKEIFLRLNRLQKDISSFMSNTKLNKLNIADYTLENLQQLKQLLANTKKEKRKEYSLNCFFNTTKVVKGGIFKRIKKKWTIYSNEDLALLEAILIIIRKCAIKSNNVNDSLNSILKYIKLIDESTINNAKDISILEKFFATYKYDFKTNINEVLEKYYSVQKSNSIKIIDITLNKKLNELSDYITKIMNKDPNSKEVKDIQYLFSLSSKQRLPSIPGFIKKYYYILKNLFPIWIMSPLEVSINLELRQNLFDYGIFDEASQMFLERSIPSIYRVDKCCVAGDPKQLKPTSYFMNKLDVDFCEEEDEEYNTESLLDKAKESSWYEVHLKNHYRSINSDLIEFSNDFIYNHSLEVATKNGCFNNPIEVYNVNGVWDEKKNSIEANSIIEYLENNYKLSNLENKDSYLVVTFNQNQSDYISDHILKKRNTNSSTSVIKKAFEAGLIRITNIENVQGDEANNVIISVTYGRTKDKKMITNFGPLNKDGASNRLNVVLTRAKNKMIIFKSLNATDLHNSQDNPNFKTFIKFIEFCDDRVKNNYKQQNVIDHNIVFDSKIEEDIYNELKKHINLSKYQLLTKFKVGTKKIDYVVYNPIVNQVVLGIEVDNYNYSNGIQKFIEDIDRQYFLKERGYKVYRISQFSWMNNKESIIQNILSVLRV